MSSLCLRCVYFVFALCAVFYVRVLCALCALCFVRCECKPACARWLNMCVFLHGSRMTCSHLSSAEPLRGINHEELIQERPVYVTKYTHTYLIDRQQQIFRRTDRCIFSRQAGMQVAIPMARQVERQPGRQIDGQTKRGNPKLWLL